MDIPVTQHSPNNQSIFNEDQWLKTLFLISDTEAWLNEVQKELIYRLPIEGKKKLHRKTFYLTASSLAHILERHYFKIQRHPNTGKFTIPVTDILSHIRDAFSQPTIPVSGSLNVQRVMDTHTTIGFDQSGQYTSVLTVISDTRGHIITAFPGALKG